MKNVPITGATGFIGGHVVKANLAKDNKVCALVLPRAMLVRLDLVSRVRRLSPVISEMTKRSDAWSLRYPYKARRYRLIFLSKKA